jgi:DNA-binding NarL/FixJ family response regulator
MRQGKAIRVLITDDDTNFTYTTHRILKKYPNIEVVGEAHDGEEAVFQAEQLQPTVVVMDINMPKMDGIAATRLIKVNFPRIAIVGFSIDSARYMTDAMLKAGATETVSKEKAAEELYAAIQRAVATIHPILIMEDVSDSVTSPTELAQSMQINLKEGSMDRTADEPIKGDSMEQKKSI